ncbi:MAG: valine--tRNA ligase [Gammaproteobacteria bacterium RIFCSPHIGHO2_12_FULL_41_20]|nr:MAG: valine--tRNA ligase [Gammaproteobacteria bacterium RIFCSPHIGHO2_12_FULL_41_20]
MEKTYNPQDIEQRWYQTWEQRGYFSPSGQGAAFSIVLPPPNVTGSLHMGHGFGFTLIDVLIRYHRMCGDNTLWQPGTDHAGIATQMVVERRLAQEGKKRHDLGREAFIEKIWEWKEESGGNITRQLRRLGASLDWQREHFTMDAALSYAVREVFIQLYNEGLIYRGKRLVNWDPILLTAISDLEVVNQEEEGHLWYIRYPLVNHETYLTIATTRPETLLGDVAVAVHPDDERYQHLLGQQIKLPLTERTIPIIADHYVDPIFGTGCVKITPAHDFNDYVVGERHKLMPINIFTPTAHLNENTPPAYQGMDRLKARKQIIEDLTTQGLIEKIEKHKLKVPRGDRSNAIIEPYLTHQWYVKSKILAEPAIRAVENGDIRFLPENWSKTYFQWMHNIEDWCISRQLWWGHRIPVWYDEAGRAYVGHDELDVHQRYQLATDIPLKQDEDVLDTWFSAALWPFTSLGWPQDTTTLHTFFPTNVLVTGFDIIFFWVARMIMLSLKFTGCIPFREVYITGLIRDAEGHKMSKSKGNVLDPIDLIDGITLDKLIEKRTYGLMQPTMAQKIEKNTRKEFPEGIPSYGTDALRFTFCSVASYTREIRFDTSRLGGYRNFCNKLWNASRYVLMNTEGHTIQITAAISLPDQWIESRLQKTIHQAHHALAQYRFDLFAQALYDFTWNEFCDWYLELSKPMLTSSQYSAEELHSTRHTLIYVLEILLRLLHPIMPFITEEIWQRIIKLTSIQGNTIMQQPYPLVDETRINEKAESDIDWVKQVVIAIRTIRSEMNIAPGKMLPVLFRKGTALDRSRETANTVLIRTLAKLETVIWLEDNAQPPESATAVIGQLEIFIPMAGLINREEEAARLQKEISKLQKDLLQITTKLANPQFVEKAPQHVVEKEKLRRIELQTTLEKLQKQGK